MDVLCVTIFVGVDVDVDVDVAVHVDVHVDLVGRYVISAQVYDVYMYACLGIFVQANEAPSVGSLIHSDSGRLSVRQHGSWRPSRTWLAPDTETVLEASGAQRGLFQLRKTKGSATRSKSCLPGISFLLAPTNRSYHVVVD